MPQVEHVVIDPATEKQVAIGAIGTDSPSRGSDHHGRGLVARTTQLAVGTVLAGLLLSGCSQEAHTQTFDKVGFTPEPPVSSSGTELLISANDALRHYGPYVLGGGLFAAAAYEFARRKNEQLGGMYAITHQSRRWPRVVFAGVVMGIAASASGLGDTASQGANEPVKALASLLGADQQKTPIITSYANTPYNYSGIDFPKVQEVTSQLGVTAVPFLQNLGEIKNPKSKANPSSAPILAVPNEILQKSLGVSLPTVKDCQEMKVIVGKQLSVPAGGEVTLNDMPAKVAATVDMKPGLDRVAVIGSLEQISKCVYPGQPMTGALVSGQEGKFVDLQEKLRATSGLPYSVRSFKDFQDKYVKFWNGSVKPPEMNLILDILLAGGIALAGMQTNEILRRRKSIAMLISQGVEPKVISRAYAIAAQRDTLRATGVSLATTTAFTTLNNSSQFGLTETVNVSSLGAGYAALAGVTILTTLTASRIIKKIDVAANLRRTA